nr:ATP-binding protein [Nesterenkonia sp. NBAIMH1]
MLIVGNLVDNALEATGDGEWVELLVRQHAVAGNAHDHLSPSRGLVEIRVTDSGPGVSPETAQQIFAAGFSTKQTQGSDRRGLGLALVRQACRRWGGNVEVDTAERTVFTAYIPAPAPAEAAAAPAEASL